MNKILRNKFYNKNTRPVHGKLQSKKNWGMTANVYSFLGGLMKIFWNRMVVMTPQFCEIL